MRTVNCASTPRTREAQSASETCRLCSPTSAASSRLQAMDPSTACRSTRRRPSCGPRRGFETQQGRARTAPTRAPDEISRRCSTAPPPPPSTLSPTRLHQGRLRLRASMAARRASLLPQLACAPCASACGNDALTASRGDRSSITGPRPPHHHTILIHRRLLPRMRLPRPRVREREDCERDVCAKERGDWTD